MRSLIAALALIVSTQASAFTAKVFVQVLSAQEVRSLELGLNAGDYTLVKAEDTEERFRCPCYKFRLTFKNLQNSQTKIYEVMTSDYDFDGELKVESLEEVTE